MPADTVFASFAIPELTRNRDRLHIVSRPFMIHGILPVGPHEYKSESPPTHDGRHAIMNRSQNHDQHAHDILAEERERKRRALESLLQQMSHPQNLSTAPRLLIDSHGQSGPRNMAIDEALLESVSQGGAPTLRFYTWSEATISLGYFQRQAPEIEPGGLFQELPVVRRLSGGGAILHHHELTYSCCLPAAHPLAEEPARLYDEMHAMIQTALAECGVSVTPRGVEEGTERSFLCFARGDRRDLIHRGFKVVGSAQRRRSKAILQHGSILLRRSPLLPEYPGLLDLVQVSFDQDCFLRKMVTLWEQLLGSEPVRSTLTPDEHELVERLQRERYSEFLDESEESFPG